MAYRCKALFNCSKFTMLYMAATDVVRRGYNSSNGVVVAVSCTVSCHANLCLVMSSNVWRRVEQYDMLKIHRYPFSYLSFLPLPLLGLNALHFKPSGSILYVSVAYWLSVSESWKYSICPWYHHNNPPWHNYYPHNKVWLPCQTFVSARWMPIVKLFLALLCTHKLQK